VQFLETEKPITPRGASRAAVMLARYCLCLSGGMDTCLWSPGPRRLVLQGVPHWVSTGRLLFPVLHSDMLSFPLWCWRVPGLGNTLCMPWRFALVIHLSSSSFAMHLTGPATPLQKLSTKMQDNTKMSLGFSMEVLGSGMDLGCSVFRVCEALLFQCGSLSQASI
jgi:hypothetical protein